MKKVPGAKWLPAPLRGFKPHPPAPLQAERGGRINSLAEMQGFFVDVALIPRKPSKLAASSLQKKTYSYLPIGTCLPTKPEVL
jgi:hypothetical protein